MAEHTSIMIDEMLEHFAGTQLSTFFEGTVGAGGHAAALLEAHPEIERYIACDRDPEALALAKERLKPWAEKVTFVRGNFADSIEPADGFFLTWESHLCSSIALKRDLALCGRDHSICA